MSSSLHRHKPSLDNSYSSTALAPAMAEILILHCTALYEENLKETFADDNTMEHNRDTNEDTAGKDGQQEDMTIGGKRMRIRTV